MWQILIRALSTAGPVALGFVGSDFVRWLGGLPLVGGFFRTQDKEGKTPWYVTLVAIVGAYFLLQLVLRKIFKSKSL